VIALVVVILLAVVLVTRDADDDTGTVAAAGPGEVFLEPAAEPGADPFTDTAAEPAPPSTVPLGAPVSLGSPSSTAPALDAPPPTASGGQTGTKSFAGGTPGLYGGTRDKGSCDREKMIAFLAANPGKAEAWAQAQGISVGEVPTYIRGLTSVVLRGDTRVTNYGFSGGRPTARQSVLEAGTAVLVDQYGEPQAKCACGNPLNPPQPVATAPRYTGPRWPKFTPGGITVVIKNITIIKTITIIDITTGTPFGRPTGPNAGPDVALPKAPTAPTGNTAPPAAGPTAPTGQPTDQCQGFTGSLVQTLTIDTHSDQPVSSQLFEPGRCLRFVFSGEADLDVNNTFAGGFDSVWCYDTNYCNPPRAAIYLVNGAELWKAFGQVAPPPFASDHRYEFTTRTEARGPVVFQLSDRVDDNRGTFRVEIYA
jgi:hypothetical protein